MTRSEDQARRMIAKGPLRFILLRGMLGWGVFMAIVLGLMTHYGFSGCCAAIRNDYRFVVLLPLAICLVAGAVWGALVYYTTLFWLRWRSR